MARLRPIKAVRVLTVEEKTRVANLFTLLIEINLQTGTTNKRRSPKTAKKKACQQPCPIKPYSASSFAKSFGEHGKATKGTCTSCHIRCVNTKTPPRTCGSSVPVRDLFLKQFNRIVEINIFNFIRKYCNDRYYYFNAC